VIFQKEVKTKKDEYNITYYVETRRKALNIVYEYIGLYNYDYRRYKIELNYDLRNEGIIMNNVIKYAEKIYTNINQTRKLAVISKFVIYIISKELDVPLYKLLKDVTYEINGETIRLSPHAFANSIYKLSSIFEKILS
jgi:hypothetical protein